MTARLNLATYLFVVISIFIGYFKPAFGDYHSNQSYAYER